MRQYFRLSSCHALAVSTPQEHIVGSELAPCAASGRPLLADMFLHGLRSHVPFAQLRLVQNGEAAQSLCFCMLMFGFVRFSMHDK